jgi:thioesterase domain-containing protein
MFGNVLNLRHFAAHLGDDQPVYALQAKGLLGNDEPHRSFVDAARDYLEEIKQVAPHGPYLLGGFSGGGVTAFEIAHQLLEAGEEVGSIIMLDAIPPHPAWPETTIVDRAQISWQRFRREVLPHPVDWIRGRIRWEFEKRERRNLSRGSERQTPAEFRSKSIEIAFRESLNCYEMRVYPGKLTLFRPPIDQTYKLWGGRCANVNRELMEHKNWWQPWTTQEVEVHVVPGDHDSMVLEPNVNVLAQKVRETLDRVQHQVAFNATAPDAPNAAIDEDASRVRGQTYARTP